MFYNIKMHYYKKKLYKTNNKGKKTNFSLNKN